MKDTKKIKPARGSRKQEEKNGDAYILKQEVSIPATWQAGYADFLVEEYYAEHLHGGEDAARKYLQGKINEAVPQDDILTFEVPLVVTRDAVEGWEQLKHKSEIFYWKPLPEYDGRTGRDADMPKFAEAETVFAPMEQLFKEWELQSADGNGSAPTAPEYPEVEMTVGEGDEKIDLNKEPSATPPSLLSHIKDAHKAEKEKYQQIFDFVESAKSSLQKGAGSEEKLKKELREANKVKAEALRAKQEAQQEKDKEYEKRTKAEATIKQHEASIKRLEEESKLYSKLVVFYREAQDVAQQATEFFATTDRLQAEIAQAKLTEIADQAAADNFNYYVLRSEKKFDKKIATLKNLQEIRRETALLAATGLLPADGLLDRKLKGVKERAMLAETLRQTLYDSALKSLAAAAVVMSDELAYLVPHMTGEAGPSNKKAFVRLTEDLRKALSALKIELAYARPLTPLNTYRHVNNTEYKKAEEIGIPAGTIFEIFDMGVNYGNENNETTVSAT